jgi:predicted metal-dependent hydrolase
MKLLTEGRTEDFFQNLICESVVNFSLSSYLESQLSLCYTRNVLDERFHRGIQEFNRGSFFEAHDVLEDLWHEYRETDRSFLQGLIQVAVGLYHLEHRNYKGARSQLSKGIAKLRQYGSHHQGIDLQDFVGRVEASLGYVERMEAGEALATEPPQTPSIMYHHDSS